jgi:hypothetical protein
LAHDIEPVKAEVSPEVDCVESAADELAQRPEEEGSIPERNYGSDGWFAEKEYVAAVAAVAAGEVADSVLVLVDEELEEMVYVVEEEDSSWPVPVELVVEAEEDRIACDSLEERSVAAHIDVVAAVVEELLKYIMVSFTVYYVVIEAVWEMYEPGELCAAPGGAIEVS